MIGQVATFMETLHLTYEEVVNRIPYRVLLIMQKDKLHEVFGEKAERISGKDMMARRMGGRPKEK